MRIDDIIQLIASSSEPVQLKFVEGRINRAIVRSQDQQMLEEELRRMLQQISERYKHGTLTARRKDGQIEVTWEESVIVGERR